MTYLTDEWTGCYKRGWGKELVPEAFSHPAKISFSLAERIYQHVLVEGWAAPGSMVIDPFAGVGGCAYHALKAGLHFSGVELEEKFVALAAQNIAQWNARYAGRFARWGTAQVIQGDSRHLCEVLQAAGVRLSMSSPPYAETGLGIRYETGVHWGTEPIEKSKERERQNKSRELSEYGNTQGQLGSMPEGCFDLSISSPPFRQTSGGVNVTQESGPLADAALIARHAAGNAAAHGYGELDGNIANLPEGDLELVVSSPPFVSVLGHGEEETRRKEYFDKIAGASGTDYSDYGSAPAQLANLPEGDASALAVSSPPYEANDQRGGHTRVAEEKHVATYGYGETLGNVGNEQGDTFWSAARLILEQTYAALAPGAHAVWVCKRYVRDGQIVDFSAQWAALCESVGFRVMHWHRALLVEDHGEQQEMNGNHKRLRKKRVSFFRRLHEKKRPDLAIDWEDVICMERV